MEAAMRMCWSRAGYMEHGTLWGHGAYLGPDYSAEYLQRLAEIARDTLARERYGHGYAELDPGTATSIDGAVRRLLKENRYDPGTGELRFTAAEAAAWVTQKEEWAQYFSGDTPAPGLPSFLLQTLAGGALAHYRVESGASYGIDLARIFPYNVLRTFHLQLAVFWIATAWVAGGLFLARVGAGIFGFLIDLPIVSYFEVGTALTSNHGHAALFGVFGMLALAVLSSACARWPKTRPGRAPSAGSRSASGD